MKCEFCFKELSYPRHNHTTSTDEEEEYTPPIETYRQDCCVVCLEAKPNILYFDCMHIAICDSCDRVKRTARARKNCDVCRAEISRRIKIQYLYNIIFRGR